MVLLADRVVTAIPSPAESVWHLGPFPLRAYALAILAGIFVAVWLTSKRWTERGGDSEQVVNIAFWAVPFGIVGGRIYHVFSSPAAYWGEGGNPVKALYIWEGGLGIWGAIALGAVGAYIGCKREGVRFSSFADAVAPGLLIAQALGRLGNWFNQELFGSPTTLPWGLEVDPELVLKFHEPAGTLFHPTFLYEMLWNLAAAGVLIYLDRRLRLGHGRVFWLYVVFYTVGRVWIEMLRIDEAELVLGLRLNVWTSIIVGLGGVIGFILVGRKHRRREETVFLVPSDPALPAETEAEDVARSDAADDAPDGEGDLRLDPVKSPDDEKTRGPDTDL